MELTDATRPIRAGEEFDVHKVEEFLHRTIESLNGNKEKAATELGISLATLYRKLPSDLKNK